MPWHDKKKHIKLRGMNVISFARFKGALSLIDKYSVRLTRITEVSPHYKLHHNINRIIHKSACGGELVVVGANS